MGQPVATEKARIDAGTQSVMVRLAIAADAPGPWRVIARATAGGETLQDRIEVTRASSKVIGDVLVFRGAPGGQSVLRPVGHAVSAYGARPPRMADSFDT